MTKDLDPAFLDRAQRSDEGQQGGLPRPRGSRHHNELSSADLDPIVEQHLATRLAATIEMVERLDPNYRQRCCHTR